MSGDAEGRHEYAVWAPEVDQVEVHIGSSGDDVVGMEHGDDGWWRHQVSAEGTGDGRYAFAIEGGDPRPDPRSLSQPDGVHAASAIVHLDEHLWQDVRWKGVPLQGSAIYEIHIGTFTEQGTLDAAIEHLDDLSELGVTTLELMPVVAFPGEAGWGYDGVSLFAVHEAYGGAQALQRFVDAAHQHGLAVYLDVVYNHFGPSGNYLAQFAPYFTDRHHTPWGEAVNLSDPSSDEVRRFILDNVSMWLRDFHLDGLRLDAVHELHDHRALHILEEMSALADEISEETGVPRVLIAESDRNDPATVSRRGAGGAGGLGLHGQWADDVHHALHVALSGETQGYYADFADPAALVKVLGDTPFLHDGTLSTFRGQKHGRPVDPDETPGWRFVASLQTHDQVGNRAAGDRLCHLTSAGLSAIGAALLLTSPYTPMLFMGEEWAASTKWQYFTDHQEEWLAQSIRDGRNAEFAAHGWSEAVPDPQATQTVVDSRLDWSERSEPPHARMLQWYQRLLRLRSTVPALRDTALGQSSVTVEGDTSLWFVRRGDVLVVANFSEEPREVDLSGERAGRYTLAVWDDATVDEDSLRIGGHDVVVLGPQDAA